MNELWLYRCSPLRAWISEATCRDTAARCAKALKAKRATDKSLPAIHLSEACPGCVGVVARSRLEGHSPRLVELSTPRPKPPRLPTMPRQRVGSMKGSRWATATFLASVRGITADQVHRALAGKVRGTLRRGKIWYLRSKAEHILSGGMDVSER